MERWSNEVLERCSDEEEHEHEQEQGQRGGKR
jgi:hypothetical protein